MVARRYWDSNIFLSWLSDETPNADKCLGVIKFAKQGQITIITSALTIAEVIKVKGRNKIPKKDEDKVKRFFENDFIAVRSVDRLIAESARQLVWQYNVDPKDAIHLATALNLNLTVFDTFDKDLIKHSQELGNRKLRIGAPDVLEQLDAFHEKSEDSENA